MLLLINHAKSQTQLRACLGVFGEFRREMARLSGDCRGAVDFRMLLILLLMAGGGLGGYSFLLDNFKPAKPDLADNQELTEKEDKEEKKNKTELGPVVDLACDVSDAVSSVEDPSAQACNREGGDFAGKDKVKSTDETKTADAETTKPEKNKKEKSPRESVDFNLRSLYEEKIRIGKWNTGCRGKNIYVSNDFKTDRNISLELNDVSDNQAYLVGLYTGPTILKNDIGTKDVANYSSTLMLNGKMMNKKPTLGKLINFSNACFAAKNDGKTFTDQEQACFTLKKGRREGWLTKERAGKRCYNKGMTRQCSVLATACGPDDPWADANFLAPAKG